MDDLSDLCNASLQAQFQEKIIRGGQNNTKKSEGDVTQTKDIFFYGLFSVALDKTK